MGRLGRIVSFRRGCTVDRLYLRIEEAEENGGLLIVFFSPPLIE